MLAQFLEPLRWFKFILELFVFLMRSIKILTEVETLRGIIIKLPFLSTFKVSGTGLVIHRAQISISIKIL